MILCVQLKTSGMAEALQAFRKEPRPRKVEGMTFARSYLTAELRSGVMPVLSVGGSLLFTAWEDDEAFDRFLDHPASAPYRDGWHARMRPARSVGLLPGLPEMPRREVDSGDLPVAGYTVGRVRAAKFLPFIKAAGAAEREAATHPGFLDGITLIRPPLVIGTFSLWRNASDIRRYATGTYPGGHKRAMDKDREQQFNTDMFFSRHIPYASAGQWRGRDPLAGLRLAEPSVGDHRPGEAPKSAAPEPTAPEPTAPGSAPVPPERVVLNGRPGGKPRPVPAAAKPDA